MIVMGLSGGPSLGQENKLELGINMFHDAAAVVLKDGKVLAAVEEERINRIKHTNKAPVKAIRECLAKCNLSLNDIDKFAVYFEHNTYKKLSYKVQEDCLDDYGDYINRFIYAEFRQTIDKNKICYVPHHYAHSESAYWLSGYKEALVVILDGAGDDSAGMIISRRANESKLLYDIPVSDSLGFFYLDITKFLGYNLFDEYKIMGLAPYGNPKTYRKLFRKFYVLLPNGKYSIRNVHLPLLHKITRPRKKDECISQIHKDIAAALQEALENIISHILTYYQKETGHKNLCMAGGVAHNCASNGKILYSNIFDSVFIQPAAHDAGCALGAALYVSEGKENLPLEHIYWGTDIGSEKEIEMKLQKWNKYISWVHMEDKDEEVATLLYQSKIIGWVQGSSEFGPRALGNRSILADPRPSKNKDIINLMVKKREGYRPFAPAIMIEYLDKYFECPNTNCDFSFMNYAIKVKQEMRDKLGAVTHVDGTARVQTVNRNTNVSFWKLLKAFYDMSGVPILLNTSFNNYAEPIVDSIDDAITCYLTTDLHYLVIGEYLITKKNISVSEMREMQIKMPLHIRMSQISTYKEPNVFDTEFEVEPNYNSAYKKKISQDTFQLLYSIGGKKVKLCELFERATANNDIDENIVWNEIRELWEKRLIILEP